MVSFKSLAILSISGLVQQTSAQATAIVPVRPIAPIVPIIPVGVCEPCIGPILATPETETDSSAIFIRPCATAGMVCCRLYTNSGLCLPRCPLIPILDPIPTPVPIDATGATALVD
ncbi:hypothetical protein BDN72DRAFT_898683 [Pluteus cervinus]|uniref:Uncharacterized protein n=1 Tax=Pluteus cervinus TaxID=181527 RepID=A0ACD3AS95_9AGAR|nr:hypothetical protein BDN72DRAFT_898683 [Pluteus cervinus]